MQEFTFTTTPNSIFETAKFVKDFATLKELSVRVSTYEDNIHVELNHDTNYKVFSDFILSISTECFERKISFSVISVLYIN